MRGEVTGVCNYLFLDASASATIIINTTTGGTKNSGGGGLISHLNTLAVSIAYSI